MFDFERPGIEVKEISEENLAKGKKIYEKPRFMTVNQALEELLEASEKSEVIPENKGLINMDNLCYGVARIGSENPTHSYRAGCCLQDYHESSSMARRRELRVPADGGSNFHGCTRIPPAKSRHAFCTGSRILRAEVPWHTNCLHWSQNH